MITVLLYFFLLYFGELKPNDQTSWDFRFHLWLLYSAHSGHSGSSQVELLNPPSQNSIFLFITKPQEPFFGRNKKGEQCRIRVRPLIHTGFLLTLRASWAANETWFFPSWLQIRTGSLLRTLVLCEAQTAFHFVGLQRAVSICLRKNYQFTPSHYLRK